MRQVQKSWKILMHKEKARSCDFHHSNIVFGHGRGSLEAVYLKTAGSIPKAQKFKNFHKRPITAIKLCAKNGSCHLCTCSEDNIIIWLKGKDDEYELKFELPGTPFGEPVSLCRFDPMDSWLALVLGHDVYIVDLQLRKLYTYLQEHSGPVTDVAFIAADIVVTASEDRTFVIWDLGNLEMIYESPALGVHPLVSLAYDTKHGRLAVGCAGGYIYTFSVLFRDKVIVRPIITLHEERLRRSFLEGKADQISLNSLEGSDEETENLLIECRILALTFSDLPYLKTSEVQECCNKDIADCSLLRAILKPAPALVIATTTGILILETKSWQILSYSNYLEIFHNEETKVAYASEVNLNLVETGRLDVMVREMFTDSLHFLEFTWACEGEAPSNCVCDTYQSSPLSLLSQLPVDANSILLRSKQKNVTPKESPTPTRNSSTPTSSKSNRGLPSPSGSRSFPVVFNKKIKSSGYREGPRHHKMFQPQINIRRSKSCESQLPFPALSSPDQSPSKVGDHRPIWRTRPKYMTMENIRRPMILKCIDLSPPEKPHEHIKISAAPIRMLRFSGSGRKLVVSTGNRMAHIVHHPQSLKSSYVSSLVQFDGEMTSVDMNLDDSLLLTTGKEVGVSLWNWRKRQTMFVIKDLGMGGSRPTDVTDARFFYMDKIILAAVRSTLHVFSFAINTNIDDIRRYAPRGKYGLLKSFDLPCQNITCMSGINTFHSYLVLCGCSDKSVHVIDLNAGKRSCLIANAHSRALHCLTLQPGSSRYEMHSGLHDLFLTSAVCDGIKLWDLRSRDCVSWFTAHENRTCPSRCAFSPCGTYLASGSDHSMVYLYDLRKPGSYMKKLIQKRNTIVDVGFSPLDRSLFSASLDGTLAHYFMDSRRRL